MWLKFLKKPFAVNEKRQLDNIAEVVIIRTGEVESICKNFKNFM